MKENCFSEQSVERKFESLAVSYQMGNEEAFSELHSQFVPLIISRARQYAGSDFDEMLSVAEGAFLRAVRTLDPERGAFIPHAETCMAQDLHRAAAKRTAKDHREVELTGYEPAASDPHGALIRKEESQYVTRVLRELLSETEYRVFSGHDLRLESYETVASDLGLSKKQVKNAHDRALRKLRENADRFRPKKI